MSSTDQTEPPAPSRSGDDDIIELTELIEEEKPSPPEAVEAEVVLALEPDDDLSSLKAAFETRTKPPAETAAPSPPESLDDFLATLPDLPDDLDIPPRTASSAPAAAAALPPDLTGGLREEELRDLVRQAVQETVERLARELLPEMAAQAIDRELGRLKKLLLEQD